MCELLGIQAEHTVVANPWLKTFFTHSDKNPHGWGMAMFEGADPHIPSHRGNGGDKGYGDRVKSTQYSPAGAADFFPQTPPLLEKEPLRADRSLYLQSRLRQDIRISALIAHIREATIGALEYRNTHPFTRRDLTGRVWTLAHNGTIFEGDLLRRYLDFQEGQTDSERILLYLVDQVNRAFKSSDGSALEAKDRCRIVDRAVSALAPGNKLNLLLYDGEILYVHTNMRKTLYQCRASGASLFATVPFLTGYSSRWEEMPFTCLCAYQDGRQIYQGEPHGQEYVPDPEMMRSLMMAYAQL